MIKGQVATMISGYEAHVSSCGLCVVLIYTAVLRQGCSKKLCNYAIKLKGTLGNDKFIKSLLDSSISSKCKKIL